MHRTTLSLDARRTSLATPPGCLRSFSFLALHVAACLSAWGAAAIVAFAAPDEIVLTAGPRNRVQQVATVVEVRGDLTVNPDGQKVRRLPMEAKAELTYVERFLPAATRGTIASVRHYTAAGADIRIQETALRQTLRSDRRLLVANLDEGLTLFSPAGPLTREELDLIDTPGASVWLDLLLPGKAVSIGGKWALSDRAVTRILSLEAVGQQDVVATLVKVEDGLAIIDLKGKVAGALGGVATEIELQGKANYHLTRKTISWLAMQYQEKREIGHAQPGYEATVRVRVQIEPATTPPELVDTAIQDVPTVAGRGQSLLEFKAEKAGLELLHDRRWQVMVDRLDTVILRLVDRGDLIAQCNITRLAPLPKGEQLSLTAFQKDVESTLGQNLGQIVEAAQSETDDGLRVLRVIVAGTASDLPIQWSYYHVSDAKGHRASVVFTLEAKLVERFAQIDRELVENLALLPSLLDETQQPKPAATKESKSARGNSAPSPAKR